MVSAKAVRQALYTKLNVASITASLDSGSASLFHAVAPSSAAPPYVIFNRQSGTPMHQFGGSHYDEQVWLVKCIVKGGSPSVAEDVDAAIATVLDFKPDDFNITGAETMQVAREGAVSYAEVVAGETYHHVGSLYRVTLQ